MMGFPLGALASLTAVRDQLAVHHGRRQQLTIDSSRESWRSVDRGREAPYTRLDSGKRFKAEEASGTRGIQ